jgi:hypothetical protein
MVKYKTFRNMLMMLVLLLIPATLLFSYANKVGEGVVKETLENSAAKQLEFTMLQLEQSLRKLETQTLLLANDSNIKAYSSSWDFPEYVDHLLMRKNVEEKLILQSQAESLIHDVSVYWPQIKEALSTKGCFEIFFIRIPAHKNDMAIRIKLADPVSQIGPVHAGHTDICEQNVRAKAFCRLQRMYAIIRLYNSLNSKLLPRQIIQDAFSRKPFIVDQ